MIEITSRVLILTSPGFQLFRNHFGGPVSTHFLFVCSDSLCWLTGSVKLAREICFWSEQKRVPQSVSRSQHAVRAASQDDLFPVRAKTSHMQGSGFFSSELTQARTPIGVIKIIWIYPLMLMGDGGGDERLVQCVQTQEQGPPSTLAKIF